MAEKKENNLFSINPEKSLN